MSGGNFGMALRHEFQAAGHGETQQLCRPPTLDRNVSEPCEEVFQVKEEKSEEDNKPANVPTFGAGCKFKRYTMSNKVTYSLTTHKIQKPRSFLFEKLDYVVIDQDLYQIQDDLLLPELEPGFSYAQLKNTEVKAIKFVAKNATTLFDRPLYIPEITPANVKIGDIKHFTDVFEPVGEEVEIYGVILSFRAIQLMQSPVNQNLVVPELLKVEKRNIIEGEQFKHCLCYAKKQVNENIVVEVPNEAIVDVNTAIYESFASKQLDNILQTLREFGAELSAIDNDDISERYVIRQVVLEEENIVSAVKEYEVLFLKAAIQLSERPADAAAFGLLGLIFRSKGCFPCFGDIVCTERNLSAKTLSEIFKIDCQINETRRSVEEELKLSFNYTIEENVLEKYTDAIPFAECCKNQTYIGFVLSKIKVFDAETRELLIAAQTKNLKEKDIKCVCTPKTLMPKSVEPLEIAAFFDSRGILEKASKMDFEEALTGSTEVITKKKGRNINIITKSSPQIMDVLFACACNINDNVAWLKTLLPKFSKEEIDYERLLTAALVAMNRKIFAFLSMEESTTAPFIFSSAKYLLTQEHARMIKEMGLCTAESIKNFSFIMSDADLFRVLNEAICNNAFKLYNNDLLEKAIFYRKSQTVNLILQSGYSFPNSSFNYTMLTAIKDVDYIQELIDIAVQEHVDCQSYNLTECFTLLIQGCVLNENIQLLKAIFAKYSEYISQDFLVGQRSNIMRAIQRLTTAEHVLELDTVFAKVIELSRVIGDKLIDGQSITVLQQFIIQATNFTTIDNLCDVCDNIDSVLNELYPRSFWQALFALKLIQRTQFVTNGEYSGTARYLSAMLSVMRDHEDSLSFMGNESISNIHPVYEDTLDTILPFNILYQIPVSGKELQEHIALNCWKLTSKQQLEFLQNMKIRTYSGLCVDTKKDNNIFDEMNAELNNVLGKIETPKLQNTTTQYNSLEFITIERDLTLLSLLIQFYGDELQQEINGLPISYHIGRSIIVNQKEREFVEVLAGGFTGAALYAAIFGLLQANQLFCYPILSKFEQMSESDLPNLLKYAIKGTTVFHEVVAIMSASQEYGMQQNPIEELLKLLPKKLRGELILLNDSLGQLPCVRHISSTNDCSKINFELAPDAACNSKGENCLHILLKMLMQPNEGQWGRNYPSGMFGGQSSGSSRQLQVLQGLNGERLKKLLSAPDNSNYTPVHYITDPEALKIALEHVDIKAIDSRLSIFKNVSQMGEAVVLLLAEKGCNLLANINPCPEKERIFESYDCLSAILQKYQQSFIYKLLQNGLVSNEAMAQHLLADNNEKFSVMIENLKVCSEERTAQLFINHICSYEEYSENMLRRLAITFAVYDNTDLLALVKQIPQAHEIMTLYGLGDMQLTEHEVSKILTLSLADHNFKEEMALVMPLISESNASLVVSFLARIISLNLFTQSHYSILEHITQNYRAKISSQALFDMAEVFLMISPPAEQEQGSLIPKLVINKFFGDISDEQLENAALDGKTLLDAMENSLFKCLDDELVEEFVERLVALEIPRNESEKVVLKEPRFVELENEAPEIGEEYAKYLSSTPALAPIPSLPGNSFMRGPDDVVYYKGRPLSMIGVQQESSFSCLKYSELKAELKISGGEYALDTGYMKERSNQLFQELNFNKCAGIEYFERPYDAFEAFKKYIYEKSGYEYECVIKQGVDVVQFPGKFKFVEIKRLGVTAAQLHNEICREINNIVDQRIGQHHSTEPKRCLVSTIFSELTDHENRIDIALEDLDYLRSLNDAELFTYLLIQYNMIASYRMISKFKSQIYGYFERAKATFVLFCNLFKFVKEHADFTVDEFLAVCGVQIDPQPISLPGKTIVRCFSEFPQLYMGGTLDAAMLSLKCNSMLLSNVFSGYSCTNQECGFQNVVWQFPCFYAGGCLQQQLFRSNYNIYRDGEITRASAKFEGFKRSGDFGSVIPLWISEERDEYL